MITALAAAVPSGREWTASFLIYALLMVGLPLPSALAHGTYVSPTALAGLAMPDPARVNPSVKVALPSLVHPYFTGNVSTISSNFNGTAVPAGDYVWFSSVLTVSGLGASPAKISVKSSTIQFTAGSTPYTVNVPDAIITFSPGGTSATTSYDAVNNTWVTSVPSTGLAGNVLLSGVVFAVPAGGLPGGINPVNWTSTFYTDTPGVAVQWKWAAAAYNTFSTDLNALGIKPVDDNSASIYKNSDHAGTPENYKTHVVGGTRGGGGSNYTGSLSGTASVTPAFAPANRPPVANAGSPQTVFVGTTVHLNGSGSSDPDGDPLTYRWAFTSVPAGSSTTLTSANSATPAFLVDKPGSYTIQLIVNDGHADSTASSVVINTQNSAPVANAGSNQSVATQSTVHLDGSASHDADGDPITYAWAFASQPAGSTAALVNPTAVNPTFVVDVKGTYVAQLTVNDGHVNSAPSNVTISTFNSPPVANPGPDQSIIAGHTVQLDGSGSTDVDGDQLAYKWSILSKPAGSSATLSDAFAVNPTFFADQLGDYIVQLIVNDGSVDSAARTLKITTGNTAPTADPGPDQTVALGGTAVLNGNGSNDPDGQSLTYRWSLLSAPAGSAAALSSATNVSTSFVADRAGNYVAQLIVNDGFVDSPAKNVVVSTINSVPVANAGPAQNVTAGTLVTLDGSGSTDADGDALTYSWSIISQPQGSTASLTNPLSVNPTFTPSVAGTYVAQLIVNDSKVNSNPATVRISAIQPNQAPVVSAGPDRTIQIPVQTITLNGSVTDDGFPAGGTLTALWQEVSGPASINFANANSASTQATFPVVGTYVVSLTGNDSQLSTTSNATITVIVAGTDQPPVVFASANQTITLPTDTVTLNGSASDDGLPLDGTLTVLWTKAVGPADVTFADATHAVTTATFTVAGTYILTLAANDGEVTTTSQVTITVNPSPFPPLVVSAGANQNIVWPTGNSVTLSGRVSGGAGSPAIAWSKVVGPDTYSISTPSALSTLVTFGAPGTYIFRLTATDSVQSKTSDVVIFVGHLDCARDNQGTDFWLTFPGACTNCAPPKYGSNAGPTLYISSEVDTTGTVSIGGLGFSAPFTVTANHVTSVVLPVGADLAAANDLIQPRAVHVSAQAPVSVYGLNPIPAATDGYLALPTATLGTDYVNISWGAFITMGTSGLPGGEFAIAASADNTTVTITPTTTVGSRHLGVPYTVKLNQGDSYQLRTVNAVSGGSPDQHIDLTGTAIHADKPIAMFGAHNCVSLPDNANFCNHIVEQLPSTDTWGTNFVTMPFVGRPSGDTFRIVASTDATHLSVNGNKVATLDHGQFYTQIIAGLATISADQPVLVGQYSNSESFGGSNPYGADPFLVIVPPYDQFGGSTTLATPTSGFDNNFINLVVPSSAKGAVQLDGTAVPAASYVDIGSSNFSGVQLTIAKGTHHITGSVPFGSTIYGYAPADGYGYTGRVCMAPARAGTQISITPQTASAPVSTQSCVTATVTDSVGTAFRDIGVTFAVSGVDSLSSSVRTDVNGQANFCYVGNSTGSDIVKASIGTVSASASINWNNNGPNQAPIVNAGANQSITLPVNTLTLNGSVFDDGLPTPVNLTVAWTQLSGPGAVNFLNPNQAVTQATFPTAGTYVLQLSANDSALTGSSTVSVVVNPVNQAPVVNAGNPASNFPNTFFTVSGSASDDGLPTGSTLTTTWANVSGPGQMSINTPNNLTTFLTANVPGTYVLSLTASDGQLSSVSYLTVNIVDSVFPNVTVTPSSQTIAITQLATLTSTVVAGTQPITYQWSLHSGPASVVFGTPNASSTQIQFTAAGHYVIDLNSTNLRGTALTQSTVDVIQPTQPPPTVSFTSPADGANVTKPTPIVGSVSNGSYTLAYRPSPKTDSDNTGWVNFASGNGPLTNATLGTLDPTLLFNGLYEVRLTASDTQFQSSSAVLGVEVKGNMKVGVETISFSDLNVSMPGLPLQIVRTYDSRDQNNVGDFGNGWRLSLLGATLQKSKTLGDGWFETVDFPGFLPRYCLQPTRQHFVSVTLPGGKVYKFSLNPSPQCQNAGPITAPTLQFTQLSTTPDTAGATLVSLGQTDLIVDGSIPGPVTLVGFDASSFNSTLYKLTTAEGFSYTMDQTLGVQSVTDPAGDTLTITPNGIVHSGGKSVVFHRDAQGRITTITDPAGNVLTYQYGDSGDLNFFVDAAQKVTSYIYQNNSHLLQNVLTPLATNNFDFALTNTYDASGRLTSTANPLGHITFTHNVPGQTETVTDSFNHPTTYTYDDDGNILTSTDALNHTTTYTYDPDGNKLTETNALGKTSHFEYDALGNRTKETNPLGLITLYEYNSQKQVTKITDALGRVTINGYDAQGNLVRSKDAQNHETVTTYLAGQPTSVTDALNHTTTFEYGGPYVTKHTDALGNVTTFTYDANGNKKSQTVTRTVNGTPQSLTTNYDYDSQNRLIKTTAPDGTFTSTGYDALGHRTSSTDARGKVTTYVYDEAGHLTQTNYPDGTHDSTTYDADGRVSTRTDRAGHFVSNTYDAAGRLTATQTGTGLTTSTTYDAAGQVTDTFDQRNNHTHYVYDDAGRRITVTNALNQSTTFGYDDNGNQTSILDANSHLTQFVYDEVGRRTTVIYPDATTDVTAYDAIGRMTSKTDQAGKVTQYGYDDLGRLASVTQSPDGGTTQYVTSYGYDELGNRVSQTDANHHTTTYAYDQLGRRTKRTLPLGQFETYAYDNSGNLQSRTDFNGHTTTYAYDDLNRLLLKTADPFFSTGACSGGVCGATQVSFTYNALGQRATMTDASGITTYTYDGNNRLQHKVTPEGGLNYSYDPVGDITETYADNWNSGGVDTRYAYDALNRMSQVTALSDYGPIGNIVSNYTYDPVGNLATVAYPNGVSHTYTYNTLNRLTNLNVSCGTTAPGCSTNSATYAYTLGPAGNRTGVTELGGRSVTYGYDGLYRLTSETISCGTAVPGCAPQLGTIGYQYDPVGNRLQLTSTVPAIPAGTLFYDANDRLSTDTYDNSGNTVASGGIGNVYDFENHLVQHGAVTIVYDGDGNRVSKTAGGVTTKFLVDTNSVTGYAQVLQETQGSSVSRKYTYGLSLISENQLIGSTQTVSFYGFDGHGSVRQLTDRFGAVSDTYTYDAFGNILSTTGLTPNNFKFAGEQFDSDLGLYYNRARYLDVREGRFWGMDTYQGRLDEPASLHRYLYARNNAPNRIDATGQEDTNIASSLTAIGSAVTLAVTQLQSALESAFEEGGGAANQVFRQMGAYAQRVAEEVLELDPELVSQEIQRDVDVAESGIGSEIDYLVSGAENAARSGEQLLIEVKYALPRTIGPPLERLVLQVNNGVQSGLGKVVLWTLQSPGVQQLRLVYNAIGANASQVQFVSGVDGLYRYLQFYLGH